MFHNPADFEFVSALEANWQTIRQEIEQVNQRDFIEWPEKHLYGKGWDVFGLYAFGMKLGKNCALCPETTKLVETIPGMVTAGFSSLVPGTHIAPHTGYPDGVLRCHLGLMGCGDGCGLRVGDRTEHWTEGKCLVFDDTTEHEAWNRGDRTRIVLLLDFKYPLIEPQKSQNDKNEEQSGGFWQNLKQKFSLR
ncbi:aspartyl/asparaginyl beta-hydroxylase domain-containing protein [Tumidithrix elongata RA019]|uniref:Aspartyl/asparaginyl beta-hydroxylase domain-containing protein n=1 Tax=Tumidithrix elongata BACA0141 TaxID=2716417 RepID=A0AAW9PTJ0_9CYAN|nr:aspartyl/asparaginyl beta-hydroxylase domain-containing protein [Tumidithrix elongata RA019]